MSEPTLWGVYSLKSDGWALHDGPLYRLDANALRDYRAKQHPDKEFAVLEYNEPGLTHTVYPYEWFIEADTPRQAKTTTKVRLYKLEWGTNTQRWAIRVTEDNGVTWATWLTTYKREGNARKRAQQMIDNGYGQWWPDGGGDKKEEQPTEQAALPFTYAVEWDEATRKRLEFNKWLVETGRVNEFAVVGSEGD